MTTGPDDWVESIIRPMGRRRNRDRIWVPYGNLSQITTDGRVRYRLRAMEHGRMRSLGVYGSIEEAREISAAIAAERRTPTEVTVRSWCDTALEAREGGHRRARTTRETRRLIEQHVAPHAIADIPIRSLRPEQVRAWVHDVSMKRAERGKRAGELLSHRTVRNALRSLSTLLADAVEAGRAPRNPALGVRVPRTASTEEEWTYLEAHEIARVLGHPELPERQRVIYTVAIYTGLRPGEMWALRWEDVRLDGQPEIVVRRSLEQAPKSGRVRRVPILPPAEDAIRRWRARGGVARATGLVWPSVGRGRRGRMHGLGYDAQWAARWREECGIRSDITFRSFRHTCASHLIMGTWGRPWRLEEVQLVLGHASRTTTERYAHLAPESIMGAAREARAAWAMAQKMTRGDES